MGKDYSDKAEEAVLPKFGETSDKVKALQTALIERGFTEVGKADGVYGPATEKAVKSFQNTVDLEVTGLADQDTFVSLLSQPVKASGKKDYSAFSVVVETKTTAPTSTGLFDLPISEENWATYRKEISKIESGGKYNIKGGANDHYDGRYQLGKMAKLDAGRLLGIELGHSSKEREAFRSNPELQEKAFAAYTAQNHRYLTSKSEKYRNLSEKEKIAVLGYAHNQGWGGAKKWLETGVEGKDAFGTSGTKYYNALTSAIK